MKILERLKEKDLYELMGSAQKAYLLAKTRAVYGPFLKSLGPMTSIDTPLLFSGLRYMEFGARVIVFRDCRIEMIDRYAGHRFTPRFVVGDETQIHQNAHITCAGSIVIGKNVVITSNVTITDINHLYLDIEEPINRQEIEVRPVEIGDQSYVYNNSVIVPGVRIGRHCVVAANSVVSSSVPDYCVVAGSPARVVKRYDPASKRWEKVAP